VPRIVEYRELALDDLTIAKAQVRTVNVGEGIAELADNIGKIGLLHPIVVCPTDKPGKYEILLGQRRYLAHRELQRKTITCAVFDEKVDPITAKIISLSENAVRSALDRRDMIDVCTALYKHYGTIADVVDKTGLSANLVRQYVKYDRLMPELKELVDKGEVDIRAAIKAQDAASVSGKPKPEEAVIFAKEMARMSGVNQDRVVEEKKANPRNSAQDIVERAKTGGRVVQVIVNLSEVVHASLQTYAKDEGTNQSDAAAILIQEALEQRGFLTEEENA
jgi:ParB family transcriptional regulator, chromosome partitioning protein